MELSQPRDQAKKHHDRIGDQIDLVYPGPGERPGEKKERLAASKKNIMDSYLKTFDSHTHTHTTAWVA